MIYDLVARGEQKQENRKTKARNEVISEKEGKKEGDFSVHSAPDSLFPRSVRVIDRFNSVIISTCCIVYPVNP